MKTILAVFVLLLISIGSAVAYPEFQRYSKATSGRTVNCAMCHTHSDGPEGLKPGQIGSLNQEELNDLGLARQAFEPGFAGKNPILNEFGNTVLKTVGKNKLTEFKQEPELLTEALTKASDLDGDGIPDFEEFKDGTHPLNSLDGHPWKLFKNNVRKNAFHIAMLLLATGFGLFGLSNLLHWLSIKTDRDGK